MGKIFIKGLNESHTVMKNEITEGLESHREHFKLSADHEHPVNNICLILEDSSYMEGMFITGETEESFIVLRFQKDVDHGIKEEAKVIPKSFLKKRELPIDVYYVHLSFGNEELKDASKSEVASVMLAYLNTERQSQLHSASAIATYFSDEAEVFPDSVMALIYNRL